MAVSTVGDCEVGTSSTSPNTATVSVPTGVQEGDLLIASSIIRSSASSVTPDQAGWTELWEVQASDVLTYGHWWRIATASEPSSYSWTAGAGFSGHHCSIRAYRGADGTTPINDSDHAVDGGFDAEGDIPSVDGVADGYLYGWIVTDAASSAPFTPPSGMTELIDYGGTDTSLSIAEKETTSTAPTGAQTFTYTGANTSEGVSIAIAPAAGASDHGVRIDLDRRQIVKIVG